MSGEHQASSSFGEPKAQPPTPQQTPTSTVFPSPVFQTPKQHGTSFDESSGWTPRFAEDISVFNSTPGNLRGSNGAFADFTGTAEPSPQLPPSGQKRPLSSEGFVAHTTTHVNHFSSNTDLPLPPVDPSKPLPSTSGIDTSTFSPSAPSNWPTSQERSPKKARGGSTDLDPSGQTATPPPSQHKGSRISASGTGGGSNMNHDHGFRQPDFGDAPHQQPTLNTFVPTPTDMFGYPLSAPATAPVYTDQRTFWDPDANMAGIDMDFSAAGGDMFHTSGAVHRSMEALDWSASHDIFQATDALAAQAQAALPLEQGEHALAAKSLMPALDACATGQAMFNGAYQTSVQDPFGIVNNAGGVNPGLLFTRPPSSSMQTAPFNPIPVATTSAAEPRTVLSKTEQLILPKPPTQQELRRSSSAKDVALNKRPDRALATSPVKQTVRPGLSRSFSDSRSKKANSRNQLPALAPAAKPKSAGQSEVHSGRPASSQSGRSTGRVSPLKSHHRLSSLTCIPESQSIPRTRTQAKFSIDANGRARVETTLVVEDEPRPSTAFRRHQRPSTRSRERHSPDEEDCSSSDEDPIIIPSRNSSFVLPDPLKPTRHPFHLSHDSLAERSSTSFGGFHNLSQDEESEAETIMNDITPRGNSGDAASELIKLRDGRHRQASASKARRNAPGIGLTVHFGRPLSSHGPLSPAALTDDSIPTPSTGSRSYGVRCVCNRVGNEDAGEDFMVQCESCEMWLHGQCVNIGRRTLPSVYICRFCANTPNMRGGRIRNSGLVANSMVGSARVTSPLAHKSFKSFR